MRRVLRLPTLLALAAALYLAADVLLPALH